MRVCSPAHSSPGRGILRKKNGEPFRVDTDSFAEAKNSELLCRVRKNMLAGIETPEVCGRCIREEAAGLISRRILERAKISFGRAEAELQTRLDGSLLDYRNSLHTFDLRFGNICNLRCLMCWPGASSAWYQEWFETRHQGFKDGEESHRLVRDTNGRIQLDSDFYNWPEKESFWRELQASIPFIRELHFSGGEPLLIKKHYALLRELVEQGRAAEIMLDYNSNITVLPDEALELWSKFKKVTIGASVDGFGKVNDYIRFPSKFQQIESNLRKLDATSDNIQIWITTTVQALNILYFTDLLQWLIESGFRKINGIGIDSGRGFFISSHALSNPACQSIQALPGELKNKVEAKFLNFHAWHENHLAEKGLPMEVRLQRWQITKDCLDAYLTLMRSEDKSHLLPQFWQEVSAADGYRKQSFETLFPELALPIRECISAQHYSENCAKAL